METYVQESLKVKKTDDEKTEKITGGPLEIEFAAFVGSYLKELSLALGQSRISQLKVTMGDVNLKLVKNRKSASRITPSAEAELERVMKPVTCRYLGIIHLNSEKKAPFAPVGSPVKKGQVLARIETMNITNEIKADRSGVLAQVLVEDGSPVEYGQILFLIEIP